nr:reverse transcriptase [Tanacetum cinerariifolium]
MKINTTSSSGLGTLLSNTITTPKEDLKGITTRSGTAYQGPMIPTTSSSLPPIVERETEATKDTVHPTNCGSTKDVQPLVVQTESPILNSERLLLPSLSPLLLPCNNPPVHDLPIGMLSPEYTTELAKSLCGTKSWVSLKYGRLFDFCYRFGRLGHGRDSYTNEVIAKYVGTWSSEMRAQCVFTIKTTTPVVCLNYCVTEPLESTFSPTPSIPPSMTIDVSFAAALSKLALKHKHDEDVISVLDLVVFETMNIHLQLPVTDSEIHKATKQLGGLKASSDDGFPNMFYQKYWNFLGVSVCQAVRYFFETGNMLPELNKTLVVFIPKTPAPQTTTHFRPISLCNFIYKIISKVLSNRLKPLMRTIISPQQSAFILGRQIQDSIVVANEAFHYI